MIDKIAFFGPAASGKTWCADYLVNAYRYQKVSFAAKLKEIASDLFNVQGKNGRDRKILQDVGQKMREIEPNIWIDHLLTTVDNFEHSVELWQFKDNPKGFVLDDLRYGNEADALRSAGFRLVKVDVPDEIREWRLSTLYPDTPLSAYYHASEQEWAHILPDHTVESVVKDQTEQELDAIVGMEKFVSKNFGSL